MSTIGTHLNWGSSYIVNDFYRQVVRPDASERELVRVGRICTVLLMAIAALMALTFLNNAAQAFNFIILSGAGTGAIYLLRWFWWRINAWTEIAGMVTATVLALVFIFLVEDDVLANALINGFTMKLLLTVAITTAVWLVTLLATRPDDQKTLENFYRLTQPGGPGWKKVAVEARRRGQPLSDPGSEQWELPLAILCVFIGCLSIYSALFAIGSFLYDRPLTGALLSTISLVGTGFLFRSFSRLRVR